MIPTEKILKASDDYASGKSSSEVFSQAHKNDFLAGAKWYEENSKAPELLEILSLILEEEGLSQKVHSNLIYNAKRIIKEATEL